MNIKILLATLLLAFSLNSQAQDNRIKVDLPEMLRDHMMANMRDHLETLELITSNLARHNYGAAADAAEKRLGMSSLQLHGAKHLGKFMPREMGMIGTRMHHAASRFAVAARNAEVDGGLDKAFTALTDVMQQCIACHAAYRVH